MWPTPRRWERFHTVLGVPFLLRELALLGGLIALFLAPVRPEHWRHMPELLGGFAAYKLGGLALAWSRPRWLPVVRHGTRTLDYLFVFLLLWFTGGPGSQHFYLLYLLLVCLDSYESGRRGGLAAASFATVLYVGDYLLAPDGSDWVHVAGRAAVLFIIGTALGVLSDRERRGRDETERLNRELVEKQQQLIQAEKLAAVGKMATKVAHEIRNPLGSISLNLELLEDDLRAPRPESSAEGQCLIEAIQKQVEALNALVEEYLRFARLPPPKVEEVKLDDLLRDLLGFLREETEGRGIAVELDTGSGLPIVEADPRLLRQALLNLVRNACEAMPKGGALSVLAHESSDGLEIAVTDTGAGIAPEHLGRVFEPFFTTKADGTGLGLAIARQIAEAHGGDISCESAPGAGTTFTLRLPSVQGRPR